MSSMSGGRRIRDEADARACLASAAGSGLSLRDWGRREGLDGRSLQAWRLNLRRRKAVVMDERSSSLTIPRLVELVAPAPSAAAVYLVHVGELRVEVGADFDAEVLRRLVRVVASC